MGRHSDSHQQGLSTSSFLMTMRKLLIIITAFVLSYSSSGYAQSSENIETLLENYCIEHYDSCFEGRSYIPKSLKVYSVRKDSVSNVLKVLGKHSYRGRYLPFVGRKTYSAVDFKAHILKIEDSWVINFFKLIWDGSLSGKREWEECSASFLIKE